MTLQTIRYGRDEMQQHEHPLADGSADVYPGMLLERVNDGGDIKVQPHGTDGGVDATVYVAVEARGRGMSHEPNPDDGTNLDFYSTDGDAFVRYVKMSGGGVHTRLAAGTDLTTAADATITVGDRLVSAGDGTVRGVNSTDGFDEDALVFEAEESVDNSGAAAGEDVALEVTTA